MACNLYVAWDDQLSEYDFGPGHPLAPVRVELTMRLARSLGVLTAPGVAVAAPAAASDAELELVHKPEYIAAVRRAGESGLSPELMQFGLGTADDPVFPGMHEASALVTGATLAAARAVALGSAEHAVSIAGGLHHAMSDHASGFCVYNDPAIAIAALLDQGLERVAYVDIDVHHGDGVQAAFYNDPRVLTISLHEDPATLFPGTGRPSETGGPGADGFAVNVALPGWHVGLRVAARVPRGRAAAAARVRAPAAGQPARLRHALDGPAGQPAADRGRAAGRARRDPPAGA